MKKILIFAASILLLAGCASVSKSENRIQTRLAELETKLDNNTKLLNTLLGIISVEEEEIDFVPENNESTININQTEYNTKDNVEALNLFLNENNYSASIGYNFNTDKRGDDLIFAFRNSYKLRGFGIIQNGTVNTLSFQMKYESYSPNNRYPSALWNGDYIVFAVTGGTAGDCGLFGYKINGRDFTTIEQIWKNQSADLRYAATRPYSEIVNNTYYVSVYRVNWYPSGARVDMKTGKIDFTDGAAEAKELLVVTKVNNLYYGILVKNNYTSYTMVSSPQYYNIFDNYKTIRSDLTPSILTQCFSYTKKRNALIDFTDNIVRPIYLNGATDNKVPATLTTIPNFEYKGKYYIKKENSNYTQFAEIKVPYDLFDDKYIKP
ncbi:MAG: hypothetical protein LBT56_00610 [Prevotellaceae bacterium]|jgi:hypothetical protein|nr:hypothetical protein [Prevotellaceae bacterium]